MENNNDNRRDGDSSPFYQCDTPRIGALTKMILEQERTPFTKIITTTAKQFGERYYVERFNDNHWLENKAFLFELETEKDPVLKARYEYEIAIRQISFDDQISHS